MNGTGRNQYPTFPNTVCPSKRHSPSLAIRWPGYLTTRNIRWEKNERSSSDIRQKSDYWSCALRRRMSRLESSVHERQQEKSEANMKKTPSRRRMKGDEIRREYRFDYRKSRPNRFAPLMKEGTVAVVLDSDVAAVFQSPKSVNSLLRSVITALPKHTKAQLKSR